MLTSMLPEDVAKEVLARKAALYRVEKVVENINGERSRYNDRHLSAFHERAESDRLDQATKHPVNAN